MKYKLTLCPQRANCFDTIVDAHALPRIGESIVGRDGHTRFVVRDVIHDVYQGTHPPVPHVVAREPKSE